MSQLLPSSLEKPTKKSYRLSTKMPTQGHEIHSDGVAEYRTLRKIREVFTNRRDILPKTEGKDAERILAQMLYTLIATLQRKLRNLSHPPLPTGEVVP
jgi:hypothetical protein